jgi:hypothetical protein
LCRSDELPTVPSDISLDGRRPVAVENDGGEVTADTHCSFEQDGPRLRARYAGGTVREGFRVGTLEDRQWDIRDVQLTAEGEMATRHSVGEVSLLEDGGVRVEDEWEWESRPGSGETVLEEIRP